MNKLSGSSGVFLARRAPFFIPFCFQIHPEFEAFYTDLSAFLEHFILMNFLRLS